MEFIQKNWIFIVIALLVIAYLAFKDKVDRWFGIAKDTAIGGNNYSCASTFYTNISDKTQNVWTTDEGTASEPNVKYYKQDVTLTADGVTNSGNPVEISKEEFVGLCKYKYNPPYAWYTATPPSIQQGHEGRSVRNYRAGGIGGGGHGGHGFGSITAFSTGFGTVPYPSYVPLFDKNGKEVNSPVAGRQYSCNPPQDCLKPYPKGSQYYGYYYCACPVSSATFG